MNDSHLSSLSSESWSKSSYSGSNSYCVEVAVTPDVVGVRDTKNRSGGALIFRPWQWIAFTDAIKADGLPG